MAISIHKLNYSLRNRKEFQDKSNNKNKHTLKITYNSILTRRVLTEKYKMSIGMDSVNSFRNIYTSYYLNI